MRSDSKNASYFDDDFEVTYEDELSFDYDTAQIDFETKELSSTRPVRQDSRHKAAWAKTSGSNYNDSYDDYADPYDEDSYDDYDEAYYNPPRHGTKRRHRHHPTRLAAPIQKGGSRILSLIRMLLRNLTLFLMLAILIFMGYNFLRGSSPYGDIENAVSTNTYTMTLAAYFSIAALLIFYEILSILWAMTRVRVRDEYGTYREDVGRGLFSFVLLYLSSHLAFFVHDWIPESMEFLKGIRGALDVFGSMHNVLFGLCLAGVISCLFRKYSISL